MSSTNKEAFGVYQGPLLRAKQGELDLKTEVLRPQLPNLLSGMVAQSTDNLDSSGESATHSIGTTANLKGKMSKRLSVGKGHFPKLVDCAHFHYDNVDFGSIELQFASDQSDANWSLGSAKDLVFLVQVSCQGKMWMVRRTYEEFCTLDAHLHQCIYDRRYSQLLPLPSLSEIGERVELFTPMLSEYLSRLSMIVDSKLNCGPVLTWMEIDNHGNRFLLKEEASLNVPAIAAAHVVKRYTAQASDEISIEVGDILSVIDMPPKDETTWWRGKHGFQVGFFPSECVKLINEVPQSVSTSSAKMECDSVSSRPGVPSAPGPPSPTSVSKKHGKLMGFLRTFMKSRPSKQKLKQSGILKERVFGCDLGEHLLNSGQDVPQVLTSCSEFIEQHGIVDGIYRHSGISSNIQKLRHEFDSENVPDLTKDVYMQDIHCVGSLCKLYFRELPNPLLTYQLYDKFADCMGEMTDDERMVKVHDVIQQLPPPHYRTLEYLMRHLACLATHREETNMHIKNLAIVWAPNLLRSKEIEAAGLSGADPFKEVRIQSVVVEFLLTNVEVLFSDSFTSVGRFGSARESLTRPKSFVSTRLLSLEEAQARSQAPLLLQGPSHPLQGRFHTVLEHPAQRKIGQKMRKATGGSWKTFFAIGKPAVAGRRKPSRITSLFQPSTSHAGCRVDSVTLRSAKSEESLSSQHSGAGQGKLQRLRRPRSSSDGLSLAASMDPQLILQPTPSQITPSRSYDSLLPDQARDGTEEDDDEGDEEDVYVLPDFSQDSASSWMAEDVPDFSPTFPDEGPIGIGSSCAVVPGGRESPPPATPPPYRRQGHARSGSQRSITEDPDSVLNQSEVAARRSLILAAAAPVQQVLCQHRPQAANNPTSSSNQPAESSVSPSHNQPPAPAVSAPSAQPPQERRSFTKKVVHALSPKAPKSPPLDISDPIAISVPAKVLEMIGGRAGELQPGTPGGGPAQPPQMISMLLRSCDFQLTESCQQELNSKLGPEGKIRGPSIIGPSGAPLPSQKPPPPPPKNPARLMALALTESANKALRQGASPPYRPRQSPPNSGAHFQRSLSADAGALLSSDAEPLYSTVRPLSVWKTEGEGEASAAGKPTDAAQEQEPRSPPGQDTGTLSSDTSASDSGTSNTELSASSSSGEQIQSPIYKNKETLSPPPKQPPKPNPLSNSEVPPQRKPPAYGRQFSAPHLQQQKPASQSMSSNQAHCQLLHSRSESSPLAQVQAFQPTHPNMPPKLVDLPQQKAPLSKPDRHDLMRRSLDAGRIRRMVGPSHVNTPLSRAYSERISSTSDALSRFHAARIASQATQAVQQQVQVQPAFSSSDDPSNMENLYYEITIPEHPPSYLQHSYQNMRPDLDGHLRLLDPANHRPQYRGHPPPYSHVQGSTKASQLWSSEAPRAWAGAHSHSFSHSRSHHHPRNDPPGPRGHPRLQRQTSSSVRLTHSELHPIPAATGSSSSVGLVPLSVHQRSHHYPLRSPSSNISASQLHPYFENGKVCYRQGFGQEEVPPSHYQPPLSKSPQASPIETQKTTSKDEPIYVNYPFIRPQVMNAKTWLTTDLDGDVQQVPEPLTPPPELSTVDEQSSNQALDHEGPTTHFKSLVQNDSTSDSRALEMPTPSAHFRSHSDPQSSSSDPSQALTAKDIASLLIEKLAEDEKEGQGVATLSSPFSSPHVEYPPNPYPSQQQQRPPPAYNIYNQGASHGHFKGQGLPQEASEAFQRQDPMRRSSSAQYRQAFDVMPSGSQVLKFHRSQDLIPTSQAESTASNPYAQRPHCQDPTPSSQTHSDTPPSSTTSLMAFSNLAFNAPRGYTQTAVSPHNQYPYQTGPVLPPYPNAPRRDVIMDPALRPPSLHNQSDLNRQGSLSGPNWTIHTEGQTRSYC
ncbi:rho GTPase-activating protein 33 [Trichomycterus rosablanca]|uniref:rho GTPase-activating protein 33 n=1 Tax=Trichomycterus rosablanca TaxID=2290929 RepID=UPI002F35CCCA